VAILELSDGTFSKEVEQSGKVVLVDFYTDTCQPCKMMEPILEKVSNEYEGEVICARLDAEKNPETAEKFRIKGVPLLILFVGGDQKQRLMGVQNEQILKSLLDFGLAISRALRG
jgi:thioredoxin 1